MGISNFLSESFLSTFAGSVIAVELIVAVTKELPFIKKIPTKIYTAAFAFTHLMIMNLTNGTLKPQISCVYCIFINAIVIAVILCGGYDIAFGRLDVASIKNGKLNISSLKKEEKDTKDK